MTDPADLRNWLYKSQYLVGMGNAEGRGPCFPKFLTKDRKTYA